MRFRFTPSNSNIKLDTNRPKLTPSIRTKPGGLHFYCPRSSPYRYRRHTGSLTGREHHASAPAEKGRENRPERGYIGGGTLRNILGTAKRSRRRWEESIKLSE